MKDIKFLESLVDIGEDIITTRRVVWMAKD
jgi:hypothetical protein